nr:CD99 antigen-like isoform X1 [Podarcis muralis]
MTQRWCLLLATGVGVALPRLSFHWLPELGAHSALAALLFGGGSPSERCCESPFWLRGCKLRAACFAAEAERARKGVRGKRGRSLHPLRGGGKQGKDPSRDWQRREVRLKSRRAAAAAAVDGGTMTRLALLVPFAALVLLAGRGRGQDFDLADAFGDPEDVTQKPIPPNKKPTQHDDDGFNLEDAFVDDPKKPEPPALPQPDPGSHGNTGDFSDLDLNDGQAPPDPPKGRASNPSSGGSDSGGKAEENPGMLAGIISSVLVAVAGAVSSFVAYQKKKLCFKASDEENVNMQSQQGAHSEPPVQRTLLQKQ